MLAVLQPTNEEDINSLIKKASFKLPELEKWDASNAYAVAIKKEEELAAIVLYFNFTEQNMDMAIASYGSGWASRKILFYLFNFAFNTRNVKRVSALSRESNSKANKLLIQCGFSIEGRHPESYDNGEAAISWGMIKENCIWIRTIN